MSAGKIQILVATNKQYPMPQSEIYLPLQVGEGEGIGFARDNQGENISHKNPFYCELTGLYYGWKNLDADVLGLVQYRRHFAGKLPFEANGKRFKVLDKSTVESSLKNADIILPKKRHYYIETLYSHYANTMYVEPLDATGEIIKEHYPQYYPQFQKLKTRRSAHLFNMFVAKRQTVNDYCTWLFDILSRLEQKVDVTKYDQFHARFFGRISELLLDVYVFTHNLKIKELKVVYPEGQKLCKKIRHFLRAKFKKEKYDQSF